MDEAWCYLPFPDVRFDAGAAFGEDNFSALTDLEMAALTASLETVVFLSPVFIIVFAITSNIRNYNDPYATLNISCIQFVQILLLPANGPEKTIQV